MTAVHVKHLENPTKQFPIAITVSAIGAVAIFVLSTLAIAFVIPAKDISLTQSLLITYTLLFHWAGVPWLGTVVAFMLAFGVLGGVVAWIAGPNTGALAVARAGYLPRCLQKTNKHGTGGHLVPLPARIT